MAGGKLIISTKVGAMPSRLGKNYPYFIDESKGNKNVYNLILKVSSLPPENVGILSKQLRTNYIEKYSVRQIIKEYQKVFNL